MSLRESDQLLNGDVEEGGGFLGEVVFDLLEFHLVGGFFGTRHFVHTAEEALVDDHTGQRGVGFERGVFHIAGLVAEDGTQEFFFRRGIAFSLRGDLTDQDVAGNDARTDTNDTVFVEILRCFFRNVGDVVGEHFHTALRFTHFE